MSDWPKDWPDDKKVGPGFLAELMKRHPTSVQVGPLEEAEQWLDEEPKPNAAQEG